MEINIHIHFAQFTNKFVIKHGNSLQMTLGQLEVSLKKIFGIREWQDTQLYLNGVLVNKHKNTDPYSNVVFSKRNNNKTLQQLGFINDDSVLIESRNNNGTWPSMFSKALTIVMEPRANQSTTTADFGIVQGICGLENLENSCYMNSIVQCFSNVTQIKEFFI